MNMLRKKSLRTSVLVSLFLFMSCSVRAQSCIGNACAVMSTGGHFTAPFQFLDFKNGGDRRVRVSYSLSWSGVGGACSPKEMLVQAHDLGSTTGAICGSTYSANWDPALPAAPPPPPPSPPPPPASVRDFRQSPPGCRQITFPITLFDENGDEYEELHPDDPNLHPPRDIRATIDGFNATTDDWRTPECNPVITLKCLAGLYQNAAHDDPTVIDTYVLQPSGSGFNLLSGNGILFSGALTQQFAWLPHNWQGSFFNDDTGTPAGELHMEAIDCNDVRMRLDFHPPGESILLLVK